MKFLISSEFSIDTACVKLRYSDGSMLAIDCDAVEDEYGKTIRHRSALDYLVYNAPLEYAELVLCGDVERYLSAIWYTKTISFSVTLCPKNGLI